jgi:hypothetical protein
MGESQEHHGSCDTPALHCAFAVLQERDERIAGWKLTVEENCYSQYVHLMNEWCACYTAKGPAHLRVHP